jgi:predicted PurR-regulated permease PerM
MDAGSTGRAATPYTARTDNRFGRRADERPEGGASAWPLVLPAGAALALGLGIVGLVWLAGRALAIIILAIALAASLAPLVGRLNRRMRRGLAVVVVYLGAAVVLVLLGWAILAPLQQQVQRLAGRGPQVISTVQQQLRSVLPRFAQQPQVVSTIMDQAAGVLRQMPSTLASFLFELLVLVFLSLYFLTVSPRIHWFLLTLFPPSRRRRVSFLLCQMAREMGGYFRATAINAAIIGTLTAVALWIVGLDVVVPLAVLAAAGEFVPYIGPIVAAIPAVAVGLLQSTQQAITVALVYAAIQQIESYIVTPNVMKSQTRVNPAMVIVALTIGYTIGGVLGAIAAIPIFAAARVLVRRAIAPAIRAAARRADRPEPA